MKTKTSGKRTAYLTMRAVLHQIIQDVRAFQKNQDASLFHERMAANEEDATAAIAKAERL